MVKIRAELVLECGGRTWIFPSKSLLSNFGKVFAALLSSPANAPLDYAGVAASTTITRLDGTEATVATEYYAPSITTGQGTPLAMGGGDNEDVQGIVVGSGSTPVDPTNYNLASMISHGTGSGQLDYDASAVTTSFGGSSSYVELYRSFTNKSGASIVVREVGIIARDIWWSGSTAVYNVNFLVARDVLPSPVTVPNLGTLTVRYRVSLSL
jgi:hypothetical protein